MIKEIKKVLPNILAYNSNWKFELLTKWHTIFGPLSSKIHLEKVEDDTLILGAQDSCWLQELYLLRPMLLKTINQTLDQPRIKHLRFKTIGIKKEKQRPKLPPKERCTKTVNLNAHELNALQDIKDPELQRALKNFLVRCYQEKT
jgi:hypothetical protein